ncbi:MAG: type VI secretion system baseplate subunit TssF [Planctomycetes bacterium]|nr:type VI secretion system baseplate subunit TssF [Planctomycetota bacterium]
MSEDLLRIYDRELRFLQKLASDFAAEQPKVGVRLRIAGEKVEDPHVRRLIEGVAYLNARVRRKLDDQFPELSTGLLSLLYPHFLAPIPSLSIVQFVAKPDLGGAYRVPRGLELDTELVDEARCRYRTCYAVEAWPIRFAGARIQALPFQAPKTPASGDAQSVLEIRLECASPQVRFAELAPERLRFYLNLPQQHAGTLYELLLNDALEIALASAPNDPEPAVLPAAALHAVGFEHDEGLLPYPAQSFVGYRLLTEYFAFPEKFHFVELRGLPAAKWARVGREARLYVYLRRSERDLESLLDKDKSASALALNCTPVVNLFEMACEPLNLDRRVDELLVVPDERRRTAFEVHSVRSVDAVVSEDRSVACAPFFGIERLARNDEQRVWWTAQHRAAEARDDEDEERVQDGPMDLWLQLAEHGVLADQANVVLLVRALVTNRELPKRLPYGNDRPHFSFASGSGPIERIRCLRKPTDPLRPAASDDRLWNLVAHLALNQISLGGEQGTQALKELLRLYDLTGSAANRAAIEGVTSLVTRRSAMRAVIDGQPGLVQGSEVVLALDADKLRTKGAFLFASVLERFLGLYAHMNTFVQLVLRASDREHEVKRWPPRAGDRSLI